MTPAVPLSAAQSNVSSADTTIQQLTFLVGGEHYAVDIADVQEIIEAGNISSVPMMPNFIKGVINLRGMAVPVVDLSARLGKKAMALTKRSSIILVEINAAESSTALATQVVGIWVDEVKEIQEIHSDHLQAPPSFGAGIKTDFMRQMARIDEQFLILLDVDHLLTRDDLAALSQVGCQTVPTDAQAV